MNCCMQIASLESLKFPIIDPSSLVGMLEAPSCAIPLSPSTLVIRDVGSICALGSTRYLDSCHHVYGRAKILL